MSPMHGWRPTGSASGVRASAPSESDAPRPSNGSDPLIRGNDGQKRKFLAGSCSGAARDRGVGAENAQLASTRAIQRGGGY
jgi:hypothetical protein